jgi:hypothetical protein
MNSLFARILGAIAIPLLLLRASAAISEEPAAAPVEAIGCSWKSRI